MNLVYSTKMLFFIFSCSFKLGTSETYYITSSPCSSTAVEQPCFTLTEFAAKAFNYSNTGGITVTMIFMPGNHYLHSRLNFTFFAEVSLLSESSDTVNITCQESASVLLQYIGQVHMENLSFIGCGGNDIYFVVQVIIRNTVFINKGKGNSTSALTLMWCSTAHILYSSFIFNSGGTFVHPKINEDNWKVGGAIMIVQSDVYINVSRFEHNRAEVGGAIFAEFNSNIFITASTFAKNDGYNGGVLSVHLYCKVVISECQFASNRAMFGGVMDVQNSIVYIETTTFSRNDVTYEGDNDTMNRYYSLYAHGSTGGVGVFIHSVVFIRNSTFSNNTAINGGVLFLIGKSNATIYSSQIVYNSAALEAGGGICADESTNIEIESTTFKHNTARVGGALYVRHTDMVLRDIEFTENSATNGGACLILNSTVRSSGSLVITHNSAKFSTIYLGNSMAYFMGSVMFSYNLNSFYIFHNSNITFNGHVTFKHSTSSSSFFQEGGAMTIYRSTVIFEGTCSMEHNHAENGGALYATESKVYTHNIITIANNTATQNGGGIYLYQSELNCNGIFKLEQNTAHVSGGGVHAISSDITVMLFASLHSAKEYKTNLIVRQNKAKRGGGLALQLNAKLYIQRLDFIYPLSPVEFAENSADYGGAIYVSDDSNYGTCSSSATSLSPLTECFFKVITVISEEEDFPIFVVPIIPFNRPFSFVYNSANHSGSVLFGGLLDRCIVSETPGYIATRELGSDAISYFTNVSNIGSEMNGVSSFPVQVCFCNGSHPDCSLDQLPPIQVEKGATFTVSLVAVDQIRNVVSATIQSRLASTDSGLGEGQLSQNVEESSICSDLTFNVFSPHDSENLTLYADGPCKDADPSTKTVHIQFLPCSCPVGFQPSLSENTTCVCECHDEIKKYVDCNLTSESFLRRTNVWVSYVNSSETIHRGYLLYPHCPFDYCGPLNVPVNLNQPSGSDAQCVFDHSGLLCGTCRPGLSLSMGSSRCLLCHTYWPGLLIGITTAAFLAGIGLVAVLLTLNMTVAVGSLNALIFYANIVAANSSIFLTFSEPNFLTVFISWLNLELGIDTCYFQGMNAYSKTWLQLAFPIYVIVIVVMVIIISHYSSKFAQFIANKNPVATLATLILLSYTKLLNTTICLLYTSPSPRDATLSRMPSSA